MPEATIGLLLQSKHKFEIATTTGGTPVYARLAAGLNSFEVGTNEETDQTQYLDGDGFGSTTVTGAQIVLSFSGHRKYGDAAQDFIYDKILTLGSDRETTFKWTQPDNTLWTCPVTIANIEGPSGDANAKGEISFEIHFNGKPVETTAPAV